MVQFKKRKNPTDAFFLSADELKSLDRLLGELNELDISLLADKIPSPGFAEAFVQRLPIDCPATPRIALGLRSSFREKKVQKAIRRLFFKLRQKGVQLPEQEDSAAPHYETPKPVQNDALAYLGPIDGTGSRPVFVSVPQVPSGVGVAMGVVNDQEGIIEFAFTRHSKKRMKEIKDVFFTHLPNMVETTLSHAADVLETCYQAKGPGLDESARAYLLFRPWLLAYSPKMERPRIYEWLASERFRSDSLTESQVQRIFAHGMMASWVIVSKSLGPLMEEIRNAQESRIFISEGQRLEHIRRIKQEGISRLFSDDTKRSLKYRLEEMAYIFFQSAEEPLARLCLAAASSLDGKPSAMRVNAFLTCLVERSLDYHLKNETTLEKPLRKESGMLIVP